MKKNEMQFFNLSDIQTIRKLIEKAPLDALTLEDVGAVQSLKMKLAEYEKQLEGKEETF